MSLRRLAAGALLLALTACGRESSVTAPVANPGEPASATAGPAAISASNANESAATAGVLMRVPSDPTVSFSIAFDVGSQDDPPGKEGLAYLTGQMIAEAATEQDSRQAILEKLYPMASAYRIRVDREMSTLTGRTHRDNIDKYVELLTNAYSSPAFLDSDFQRIKRDTINYLSNTLRYASDEELGKAVLYDFIFSGTAYAHPSEGTVASLEAITLDDVREFYDRHFRPENARVSLGGNFDDALVGKMIPTTDTEPSPPTRRNPAPAPPIEGRHVVLVDKPGADASISFGFPLDVERGERDFYALWIANSWLGEHRNQASHLFKVIRERRGLNYGDYSYIEAFPDGGSRQMPPVNVPRHRQIFEVWIRTLPNDQALFAMRAALRELTMLVDDGMTREEFELTRTFLKKYVLQFADTTSLRLGYAVDDRFYGIGDEGHLARFARMMDELDLEDVNSAIRRHLQYANIKFAIVTGDAEGLRKAIADDASTPITYTSPKPEEILAEDAVIESFPLDIPADNIEIRPVDSIFEGR